MSEYVTSLELITIEKVLQMDSGYVLDFKNRSFSDFFMEHKVLIYDDYFASHGDSKANRMRCFLQRVGPPRSGQVLAALLERRVVTDPEGLADIDKQRYVKIVERLGGDVGREVSATSTEDSSEQRLLQLVFRPEIFDRLPGDQAIRDALVGRMKEAQRCIEVESYLAAVILCGSVLEGMCLGYGSSNPEKANRGFTAQYGKPPKKLYEWTLAEWITVLCRLGELSQNVAKFSHGLREFRNYVHPAEQLANNFVPDARTARIGFQVVVAAAEDLTQGAQP